MQVSAVMAERAGCPGTYLRRRVRRVAQALYGQKTFFVSSLEKKSASAFLSSFFSFRVFFFPSLLLPPYLGAPFNFRPFLPKTLEVVFEPLPAVVPPSAAVLRVVIPVIAIHVRLCEAARARLGPGRCRAGRVSEPLGRHVPGRPAGLQVYLQMLILPHPSPTRRHALDSLQMPAFSSPCTWNSSGGGGELCRGRRTENRNCRRFSRFAPGSCCFVVSGWARLSLARLRRASAVPRGTAARPRGGRGGAGASRGVGKGLAVVTEPLASPSGR